MRVPFFQGFNDIEVALNRDVHRKLGNVFVGVRVESEAARFEGMLATPGDFLRIRRSRTTGLALALSAFVPLNKIASLGERFPIWSSVFVAGDGDQFPAVSDFHLLENVDTRHATS